MDTSFLREPVRLHRNLSVLPEGEQNYFNLFTSMVNAIYHFFAFINRRFRSQDTLSQRVDTLERLWNGRATASPCRRTHHDEEVISETEMILEQLQASIDSNFSAISELKVHLQYLIINVNEQHRTLIGLTNRIISIERSVQNQSYDHIPQLSVQEELLSTQMQPLYSSVNASQGNDVIPFQDENGRNTAPR